jgi:hypothetical protein
MTWHNFKYIFIAILQAEKLGEAKQLAKIQDLRPQALMKQKLSYSTQCAKLQRAFVHLGNFFSFKKFDKELGEVQIK